MQRMQSQTTQVQVQASAQGRVYRHRRHESSQHLSLAGDLHAGADVREGEVRDEDCLLLLLLCDVVGLHLRARGVRRLENELPCAGELSEVEVVIVAERERESTRVEVALEGCGAELTLGRIKVRVHCRQLNVHLCGIRSGNTNCYEQEKKK